MNEQLTIRFTAQIVQVKTTVDFGTRLTLDLPENQVNALHQLIAAFQHGALLEIAAVQVGPEVGT